MDDKMLDLINELDHKYGSIVNAPESDPQLKELRKLAGSENNTRKKITKSQRATIDSFLAKADGVWSSEETTQRINRYGNLGRKIGVQTVRNYMNEFGGEFKKNYGHKKPKQVAEYMRIETPKSRFNKDELRVIDWWISKGEQNHWTVEEVTLMINQNSENELQVTMQEIADRASLSRINLEMEW